MAVSVGGEWPALLWAGLLAAVAGYVDAICYVCLGRVFAANMTGNLVLIGMSIAAAEWHRAAFCAAIILAFFYGVVAARALLQSPLPSRLAPAIEAAAIALAGTGRLGIATAPLLAAAIAVQNEAVRHGIVSVNVAFITGDLQRLGERLLPTAGPTPRRGPARQSQIILAVLLCYAVGAGLGGVAARLGLPALFGAAGVLAAVAAVPGCWTRHDEGRG